MQDQPSATTKAEPGSLRLHASYNLVVALDQIAQGAGAQGITAAARVPQP